MAITSGVKLVNGTDLANSAGSLYTVPGTINRVQITFARLVNHTAGAITVDIYILMNGEAVADRFKALDTVSIGANEERLVSEIVGDVINSGGSIQGVAGSASSVSFSAVGIQYTT